LPLPVTQAGEATVEEQHRADLLRPMVCSPGTESCSLVLRQRKRSVAEGITEALAVQFFRCDMTPCPAHTSAETNTRLARLFDLCPYLPCVLLFDEFDSIEKERGDNHETVRLTRRLIPAYADRSAPELRRHCCGDEPRRTARSSSMAPISTVGFPLPQPAPGRCGLSGAPIRFMSWAFKRRRCLTKLGNISFAEALEFPDRAPSPYSLSLQ